MNSRLLDLATGIYLAICSMYPAYGGTIKYTLSMPAPETHCFEVKIIHEATSNEYTDFIMPAWTPGSYLIRDFAKNVMDVKASDESQNQLKIVKIDKNTWRVYHNEPRMIALIYKVYAFELSVRTSYLDDVHASISGPGVFMYPDGHSDLPVQLLVELPSYWSRITTGLASDPVNPTAFHASNYDQLVDCPIEIGNHLTFSFSAAGVDHEVAMVGPGNFDIDRLKTDMARIVKACTDIFGENPNQRYVFIIYNLENGGGGLEHSNSAFIQVNRWSYQPDNAYLGVLSLIAHEYLHLWIGKRLRPASLLRYDYTKENYTDLLWIMEGFPSYYDDIMLSRMGYISGEDYLRRLNGAINSVESTPGSRVQAVSDASFDAWIKQYQPDENQNNSTVSYYTKGNKLAALLDLEIIQSTKGEKCMDDLLKTLYTKYYKENIKGITLEDFRNGVEAITGHDQKSFFAEYVTGTGEIDYEKYLGYAGIEVRNMLEGDQSPFLGIAIRENDGKTIVQSVASGSSGQKAGISPRDEIIGADAFRLTSEGIMSLLNTKNTGDTVRLLIARDGKIMEKNLVLFPANRKQFHLYRPDHATDLQNKVYRKWTRGQ
ncbi:MAG TPA: PDZ domain-containing protein [Cyclobacteriaceae bacterium]|nr:PDZ domain-containing protein [Cyclobacteriaceae bacterium]